MRETRVFTVEPHPDVELGCVRKPIDVHLIMPEKGINEDTGVILVLGDFDQYADSKELKEEFCPYLADKLNCISIGVNYFGIYRNKSIEIKESFLHNFNRIYNGAELCFDEFKKMRTQDEIFRLMAERVISRGITSLDIRCQPTMVTSRGEYQSWGFLPAIDCLQALGQTLREYEINQRRIMVYGRGYGAYIALLLGKYAPHTFSVIIDREGYAKAELRHIVSGELMTVDYEYAFNIRHSDLKFTISAGSNNPWTIDDELSGAYFSDSHRKIRSMIVEKHRIASETRYYILHTEDNYASSIKDKDACVFHLSKCNPVYYNRIPCLHSAEESLLGEKRLPNESLDMLHDQDIINWVAEIDQEDLSKETPSTDYNLNSTHVFDCGEREYRFQFRDDYSLQVVIGNKP
ncbi:MAG: DUF2920 family protein [Syntrophomonadaceae bacterium]|nr:DUF2920 family protein [Syntrophomonadaceae bacterium]